MSNTRDNSPELDYFELRRRHEEYKNRARMEQSAERLSAQEPAAEKPVQPVAAPAEVKAVEPQPEFVEEIEEKDDYIPDDFEAAIEEGYEDFEEEDFEDEPEEGDVNPNPFDSFIHFFNGVKNSISNRRKAKGDELDEDELLDELTDEELAELEAEELEEGDFIPAKSAPAPRAAAPAADDYEDEDFGGNIADVEDTLPRAAARIETGFDEDEEIFSDDDFEDLEEDELPRKSGFKKFMGLFVSRIDEEEADEDEDEDELNEEEIEELEDKDFDDEDFEEKPAPKRRGLFGRAKKQEEPEEEADLEPVNEMDSFESDFIQSVHSAPKGGQKMDEMKKTAAPEAAQQTAAVEVGMTRRERRELAMRLAAEEAARKAEEEARLQAQVAAIEPLFTDAQPEEKAADVDMAAFENAPETDIIVETTAEEAPAVEESVEEPTREFKPVSMRDVEEAAQNDLFDVDEDDEDDDFDDDDDDEEEIIEKKPRRGLFGRKRARIEEDEEDDEDEDDEDYDDDEDDDDDDEIVEKKPRRGLFGRKRARVEEDDEDDEDEEEDEYDDDEDDADDNYDDDGDDDEYDEYDDEEDEEDYDDEYDDDDDEPRRSFGHHLLGIIKGVLGLILILLVAVIVLNFLYIGGTDTIVPKLHDTMGGSAAFNVLFPSYTIRESLPAEEADPEIIVEEAELTPEPTALPEPEATVAIPNLDTNDDITEAPVIESAPVVAAAPAAEQLPAAGAIG